jgi:ferredoxin-NADP reductase/sterol desaturase/sphingolipid hydroxylase (fatty acid hydroxylase superfamily)
MSQNPLLNFIIDNGTSVLTNLVSTLGLIAAVYLLVWVIFSKRFAKNKIQLTKRAGCSQIKNEIISTIFVIMINVLFLSVIFWLRDNGYSQFYTETGKYGLWFEFFTFIVVFLISDTWFYWAHRALHHPKIYKYIHAVHHQSLDTNPFTSYSFHVIEGILLTLWIIPVALFFPVSLFSLGLNQGIGLFNNIKSHLGYEFYPKFFARVFPLNMLVTSTNHNLHHTRYNGNYGLQIRFWDIVCDTEIKETKDVFVGIHERNEVKIMDNTKYQQVTITNIIHETKDTTSIYFESPNQEFYNYLPGQYVNIRLIINNKVHERSFSLSSSPKDKFLRITVKLNGEVSHYFHNKAKVGDTFESLLPEGDFGIQTDAKNPKNYLMVGGGSGITALYSMINTLLIDEPKSKITLFYSNKSLESTIFAKEISDLVQKYPNFKVLNFISGINRLSENNIAEYVQTNQLFECYICGPEALKKAVRKYLLNVKVNESNMHSEGFVDGYKSIFSLLN